MKLFLKQLNKDFENQRGKEGLDVTVESKEKEKVYEAEALIDKPNLMERVWIYSILLKPL